MKTIPIALTLLLLSPLAGADEENSVPFRIAALEEATYQQQLDIDALMSQGGGGTGWVVTSLLPGEQEGGDRQVIGQVVSFVFPNTVVVETEIADHPVLLWIGFPDHINLPSRLVFTSDDCSLGAGEQQYATPPPGDWWYKEVFMAPGPEANGDSAVAYLPDVGLPQTDGPWQSRWEPDGCHQFEVAPGVPGAVPIPAVPVSQLGDDLFVIYPRAPEPWMLAHE